MVADESSKPWQIGVDTNLTRNLFSLNQFPMMTNIRLPSVINDTLSLINYVTGTIDFVGSTYVNLLFIVSNTLKSINEIFLIAKKISSKNISFDSRAKKLVLISVVFSLVYVLIKIKAIRQRRRLCESLSRQV